MERSEDEPFDSPSLTEHPQYCALRLVGEVSLVYVEMVPLLQNVNPIIGEFVVAHFHKRILRCEILNAGF